MLFTTPQKPGTRRTTSSMTHRSSNLRVLPCRVTTNLQELTFGYGRPCIFARPKVPRTSWTRRISLATGASPGPGGMLILELFSLRRTQFGEEGEPTVAQPTLVQRLLELGFAGILDLAGPVGCGLDEGGEVLLLARGEAVGVEIALILPLEEPHAPGEGDEDAARLGAGDLALPPIHLQRGPRVHVP